MAYRPASISPPELIHWNLRDSLTPNLGSIRVLLLGTYRGTFTISTSLFRLQCWRELALINNLAVAQQNQRIADTISREQGRLRRFIRRQVVEDADAEDILQEVFFELVEATRLMKPIEQVGAWLFRVARNRIVDLFRRKKPETSMSWPVSTAKDGQELMFEDLLSSADAGPDATYARQVLLEELEAALAELPEEQRDVFIAHELEGRPFKELAAEAGLSVNTLLARKHYAVTRLRRRLSAIYNEFRNT